MRGTRLLLVEDDPEDAEIVSRIFSSHRSHDYVLEWARDAEEAYGRLQEKAYDAILLDFFLGRDTAVDFVQHLPANKSDIAIIVLTGGSDSSVDDSSFGVGVDFFLSKEDMNSRTLERAVRYAIRNREQQERLRNFSRLVAHDIKGPMGNIGNVFQILGKEVKIEGPADADDLITLASKECHRIQGLVSDLHDYALSQSGALATESHKLGDVCREACDLLRAEVERRGACVEMQSLPEADVDSRLLLHVFQNLIQNGIKYNRSETPEINIDCLVRSGWVFVRFTDNGIGIDREDASKIFEPMTRLDVNGEFVGSGLGLAICKEIVERHGGRIWTEPREDGGTGSVFVVQLPYGQKESVAENVAMLQVGQR